MGRPWVRGRRVSLASGPSGSMRLAFYCCLACVWTATLTAADVDIYPEADLSVQETKRVEYENQRVDEPVISETVTTKPSQEKEIWNDDVVSEANDSTELPDDDMSYVFKRTLSQTNRDIILVAVVAACGAAAAAGVIALFYGWYKLHSNSKAAADIEYPAYGVTGPNKEISPTGDRRLAQSAQMYHYQHQKQQIIAMESNRASNERRGSVSEGDSDEENEEGDYTVYECPGLAATGELEVKNPLFLDDPTPATGNHTAEKPSSPADLK